MKRLQRYAAKVQGSNQYWFHRYHELRALLDQKGPPTFFWTVSSKRVTDAREDQPDADTTYIDAYKSFLRAPQGAMYVPHCADEPEQDIAESESSKSENEDFSKTNTGCFCAVCI